MYDHFKQFLGEGGGKGGKPRFRKLEWLEERIQLLSVVLFGAAHGNEVKLGKKCEKQVNPSRRCQGTKGFPLNTTG